MTHHRRDWVLWFLAAALAVAGITTLLLPDTPPTEAATSPYPSPSARSIPQPHPTRSPPSTPTPTRSPTSQPSQAGTPLPTQPRAAPWREVTEGFATAFTRPGPHAAWLQHLHHWVSPYLANQYASIDPRRRPSGTPTQIEPAVVGEHTVEAVVTYSTGLMLRVRAETTAGKWQVTMVEPLTLPGRDPS